jgi:hypothetical protein
MATTPVLDLLTVRSERVRDARRPLQTQIS